MLKISYRGHKKEKETAKEILSRIPNLTRMKEAGTRLKIQDVIDECDLKATILVNGNNVWSKKKILRNLTIIMKKGVLLSNTIKNGAHLMKTGTGLIIPSATYYRPILSKYFYEFLTSCCGSIAHYNIYGWIHHYPTVDYLKKFFQRNEFGKPVRDWIPWWQTDAKRIVEEIEQKLFPFQTFMKSKSN